jgi:hypothetical protein
MPVTDEQNEVWSIADDRSVSKRNPIKSYYEPTRWGFIFLALASVSVQATRTVHMSPLHQNILDVSELAITIAFDIEIVIRILGELPNWRAFFNYWTNWFDLLLATVSSIIQITAIRKSSVYPWLTIFQLARFYRVILAIPRTRRLMVRFSMCLVSFALNCTFTQLAVFGNMYGLANMTMFLILVNFLAALVGVQLLRGDLDTDQTVNFGTLYNAFLGVYQVFSSENWTEVLYGAAEAELRLGQTVIVVIFIASWMLFANCKFHSF